MLNNFYLTYLRFQLRFAREVSVSPLYAGSMLRGAFGTALRRIVCLDFHQNCSDCITRESCAYQKIFSPITPIDAGRLAKNRDMPRGFIIKPPLMDKRKPETLTLNFLTPTLLMFNPDGRRGASRQMRVPEFHVVVKRLRDRINRLATAFCGTELQIDYKELGRRAEEVKISSVQGEWQEKSRRTRAGERQDLSGFVGSVIYEGDFEEFFPLLRLGEYLHVGKNAAFGNGWYRVGR